MMAETRAQRPVCSHGVRYVDPIGICTACRDESNPALSPACREPGCTSAPTPSARGRMAGLCFEHLVAASERYEAQRDFLIARTMDEHRRALSDEQAALSRGGL